MPRLTVMDEHFVHQIPEPLPQVTIKHEHWRESLFFIAHRPDSIGDLLILTMATYPQREMIDSLQMGRIGGEPVIGLQVRSYDGDPHTMNVGAASVEIVKPFEEINLWADGDRCELGLDLTFYARTKAYGLRRGTLKDGDEIIWDQSHMLQSGHYDGTYSYKGTTHSVDGWWGQRDHSWGIRNHGRCPLWMWLQIQLVDGFLGVWHWELSNGARIYTDGCWAPIDGSEPVPVVDFAHDLMWVDGEGKPMDYTADAHGINGTAAFGLEGGQRIVVEAEGTFDRPYEPFHRGGLNQVRVRTADGREGTAIFEITGSRHHRYFPQS
jgi:hypothetical protein